MARYALDDHGHITCPKTGCSVNPNRHCIRIKCAHYGFWYGADCFVCRYTRERDLRIEGNNGNHTINYARSPITLK